MARDRPAAAALAAAALLALGATAGCGASAKNAAPHPAAPATPAPAPAPPTTADLRARLLTLADMPPGFVTDADTEDANGVMSSTEPDCRAMTDLMNSKGHPAGAVAAADASFTRSQLGPNVATGLAGFATPEAAQSLLASVTKATHTCTTLTETDQDGSTYDFLVTPLTSPQTGEAGTAIRIAADVDDMSAQVDLVLVRVGDTLLYVADTTFGTDDPNLTQDVVKRAVAKVEDPVRAGDAAGAATRSSSA